MKQLNKAAKTLARNGWRLHHALILLAVVSVAIFFTWPAWAEMYGKVMSHDYARTSVLVLPIMAWLVWVRRARFRFVKPGGPGLGIIVLISGIHLYLVAEHVYGLRSAGHRQVRRSAGPARLGDLTAACALPRDDRGPGRQADSAL